ncbi:uncharacterized protein LOC130744576 [Lotus japonicus]|uniref:uncharacterized protein LOC130744576 n=1 Tax=Lotus japonicus TaxID=34305 RepID=UPI00258C518E|nr:uncharacterized protein LOC130744576 [Lotus japonicus]
MSIQRRFSSVEHPQTNGQAESANKVILRGLKRRLFEAKGAWLDELPVVIWSYKTTQHSTTGETPFRMTYGADAMLPVEINNSSWRTAPQFEGQNPSNMAVELDLLSETRDEARIRKSAMKQRAAAKYDTKVRPRAMQEGDLVLKKRTGNTGNKLDSIWEGPYRILKVSGKGGYHLESLDGRRVPRSWNAASLRYYYS